MNPEQFEEKQEKLQKLKNQSKEPLHLNQTIEEDVITKDYGNERKKPIQVFSPSQVGYCKRQLYNRKMSLTEMDRYVQGILHAGTRNHFWLEHNLPQHFDDRALETERKFRHRIPLEDEEFDLYVSGYADAVDSEGYVYDHKFTGGTSHKEEEPGEKDKRQVMMYTYCLPDVHTGRLEYVLRDGKFGKNEYQPYMVEHQVDFEPETFADTLNNMLEVAKAVMEREGTDKELVNPFDRCDRDDGDPCFYCEGDHKEFRQDVKRELKEQGEWKGQVKA